MKQIAVLGSTGSIGTQTLEVVRANEDMQIVTLAAGSNIDLLEKQIVEFTPKLVCVYLEDKAKELQERLHLRKDAAADTEIVTGMDGLIACATYSEATIVVAAVVGMIGIRPVIEAIKSGKDIAFANKETLVVRPVTSLCLWWRSMALSYCRWTVNMQLFFSVCMARNMALYIKFCLRHPVDRSVVKRKRN